MYEGCNFSMSSPIYVILCLFYYSHPSGCVISHIDTDIGDIDMDMEMDIHIHIH